MKLLQLLIFGIFMLICSSTYQKNFALSFDGKNDVVKIASLSTDEVLLNEWTLEAWIKPNGDQKIFQPNIVGFPRRHPNLELCGNSVSCDKPYQMITQLREENGVYFSIVGKSKLVEENVWNHVAGSWNNETLNLYINGEIASSMKPYTQDYKNPMYCSGMDCEEGMQIGGYRCCHNVSDQYFSGLIDEVRVWKVGRTQTQIKESMKKTLSGKENGLVYYWRFDEAEGTLITSLADDGYGTLGGGIKDAEPKWVSSDSPLDDIYPLEPHTKDTVTSYSITVISCIVATILMFVIGITIGVYVIPKVKAMNAARRGGSREEDASFL